MRDEKKGREGEKAREEIMREWEAEEKLREEGADKARRYGNEFHHYGSATSGERAEKERKAKAERARREADGVWTGVIWVGMSALQKMNELRGAGERRRWIEDSMADRKEMGWGGGLRGREDATGGS